MKIWKCMRIYKDRNVPSMFSVNKFIAGFVVHADAKLEHSRDSKSIPNF